jgi:hypothetical protein
VNSETLSAPQTQLRQTRDEVRALIAEMQTDSFPRSVTMKLLLSDGGRKAIGYMIGGGAHLGATSRFGRVIRSVVLGVVIKKLLSRIRK